MRKKWEYTRPRYISRFVRRYGKSTRELVAIAKARGVVISQGTIHRELSLGGEAEQAMLDRLGITRSTVKYKYNKFRCRWEKK